MKKSKIFRFILEFSENQFFFSILFEILNKKDFLLEMSYMIKDSFRILKNTLTAFTFIQKNNTKNQF